VAEAGKQGKGEAVTYQGKNLPAWVRFKRRAPEKPVYTVPTATQALIEATMRIFGARMAEAITRGNALLHDLREAEPAAGDVVQIDRRPHPWWRNNGQ